MPKRSSKKLDPNALATQIVGDAMATAPREGAQREKNPAAVALGRLGGIRGGKARAAKLSKKRRSEIARKAAQKRWGYDS